MRINARIDSAEFSVASNRSSSNMGCCLFYPKVLLGIYILGSLAGVAAMVAFPLKYSYWGTGFAGAIAFIFATWLVFDMIAHHSLSGQKLTAYPGESSLSLHMKAFIALVGVVFSFVAMIFFITIGVLNPHAQDYMTAVQCWMILKWSSSVLCHLYYHHQVKGGAGFVSLPGRISGAEYTAIE
ncbi:hypothetical protein PROFUN_13836 [Planoprotostelium fungivorum]|uniref:Uncharacterized protein n=1 Tax=Planoprotostelium fungivorum TaxID=1890364 RepID=A0A2P6N2Z8_9EUKA|nr:hypothetical protein PROFUN_13836 [Planoprotostelium fungivorum]